jgi:hypothetical protein
LHFACEGEPESAEQACRAGDRSLKTPRDASFRHALAVASCQQEAGP